MRAYSVGSRSDTSALGKLRSGKNRLEAVQETIRIRAMSVGSKNARKPPVHSNTSSNSSNTGTSKNIGVGPLSSSWSGSTGRWPMPKFTNSHHYLPNQNQHYKPSFSQTNSESTDSDLMELDFSKNKTRKRSNPGPLASLSSTPNSTSSNMQKISPGMLAATGMKEGPDSFEVPKSSPSPSFSRASSAPISIKGGASRVSDYAYHDISNSQSILVRLTGTDLKNLKELDDEGAYLDMDFSKPSNKVTGEASKKNAFTDISSKNTVENVAVAPAPTSTQKLCLDLSSTPPVVTSLNKVTEPPMDVSKKGESSVEAQSQSSSCAVDKSLPPVSKNSLASCSDLLEPTLLTSGLTRIEESPEKQEHSKASSGSVTPQSPSRCAPLAKPEDDHQVTYASIDHLPTVCRTSSFGLGIGVAACGTANKGVTYAQIDFVKTAESVKPT